MPLVNICVGANELDCAVEVNVHPPERMVMYDSNGEGYPGSPAYGEIVGAIITEENNRKVTDDEWAEIERRQDEIEKLAFEEIKTYDAFSEWWKDD